MTLSWNSLKTAENGWKLDAAQRHRIYDNCLRGEKVGGFQWQFVWKPAAYLAAAAAMVMLALFFWPQRDNTKKIMVPGSSGAKPAPYVENETGDQDAEEALYAFEPYGSDVFYEAKDGDGRSIYRVTLGSKSAPDPVVKKAALLTVEGDYMIFNQAGKLWMMDLKKGGKTTEVGEAATAVVESWQNHVLLKRFDSKNERYQTVLLDLAEQKQTVYELDYYIADATRIGDTLYYTEWKYGATEGKELKAYSFADGSVETYCRIRTGSALHEFYLADGRLYYLEEALMYCDLQTKETYQAIKPVGFSDRNFCGYYQDRLYLVTSSDFVIYDLKAQQTVATLSESIRYCFSNEYGVVYYDDNERTFTVVQESGSYTVDGSQYESVGFSAFGGTVCEQGFAATARNLAFFVRDAKEYMVLRTDGKTADTLWFSQPDPNEEKSLTAEQVIELAKKGQELSYRDFDGYRYEQKAGERVYRIDEQFRVEVGYDEELDLTHSVFLIANDTAVDSIMDLRTADPKAFFEAHRGAYVLTPINFERNGIRSTQPYPGFSEFLELYNETPYREGIARIDTYERYRELVGENVQEEYDAEFFKAKSLLVIDVEFVQGNYGLRDFELGKLNGTLYMNVQKIRAINLDGVAALRYTFYQLEVSKEQLKDVERIELRVTLDDYCDG